jgi:hypothetical protein
MICIYRLGSKWKRLQGDPGQEQRDSSGTDELE